MVSDNEKKALEADFNMLVAKGNSSANIQKEKLIKESINVSWELNVEFYPLEAYQKRIEENNSKNQQLIEVEGKKNNISIGKSNILLGLIIIILLLIIAVLLI